MYPTYIIISSSSAYKNLPERVWKTRDVPRSISINAYKPVWRESRIHTYYRRSAKCMYFENAEEYTWCLLDVNVFTTYIFVSDS